MSKKAFPGRPNYREVEVCGVCDSTAIHYRVTKEPPYRCECGNEFTSPTIRTTKNGGTDTQSLIEQMIMDDDD